MAVLSTCARLVNGYDAACISLVRKYHQQAVIINKVDILESEITKPDPESDTCNYRVSFTLKPGTTGYRISGPEAGSSFFGTFDKARNDYGHPQYTHNAQVLIVGNDEAAKCIIDSLDKGSFIVAMQTTDGKVEIFGFQNGLTTGDYTYDLQGGGGGTPIMLSSLETSPEGLLPLVYEAAVPGEENADFDEAFANILSA